MSVVHTCKNCGKETVVERVFSVKTIVVLIKDENAY